MRSHASPVRGLASAARSPLFQGKFGRMFRTLPHATFGRSDASNEANLRALATAMTAAPDKIKDGPDSEESGIPALYTYFGQFIDHDLTFDPASSLQKQNDPNALTDFRTPAFDLDNVYGRGPDDQPYFYNDKGEFVLGEPLQNGEPGATDLPRFFLDPARKTGRALIGDPRNDENAIVSQFQGLFHRFHNRLLKDTQLPFADIQQLVRYHYQYVVVNDFLPRLVMSSVLDHLKSNGAYNAHKLDFYRWRNDPYMPVEFSGAAYRYGHSQVRPGYRLNGSTKLKAIFPDLVGFAPAQAENGIEWARFIDIGQPQPNQTGEDDPRMRLQFAYRIDTSIVDPLSKLPASVGGAIPSLPFRNLDRGWRLGLPSGQAVARAMGLRPLHNEEIFIGKAEDDATGLPNILSVPGAEPNVFKNNCPLWTYVLAEAALHKKAVTVPVAEPNHIIQTPQLGPVGGRIVAEVFLGLLFGDGGSYLSQHPDWQPASGANYKLKDFVNYALGK